MSRETKRGAGAADSVAANRAMNVWYLVFRPDSLTYTIAKAIAFGGWNVSVWVVDREFDRRPAEAIPRRLRETPNVDIVTSDESRLPSVIDRLIVQVFPRPAESIRDVDLLARRALRISVVTAGDRSRSWTDALKLQWAELGSLARRLPRIDRVAYKDGFHPRDLFGILKPRTVVGFDVHSQFLHDEALYHAMHARDWIPEARRPILVNFLGSRDPPVREHTLAGLRPFFPTANAGQSPAISPKAMVWHEYPDSDPVGVPPLDFVKILTDSDFTLCPRGYSVVTHRPIEALLRGSIPVLSRDHLDLYGLELEDGVNCIAAPIGDWGQAIERITAVDQDRITAMRSTVRSMVDRDLNYATLARAIRTRVGVTP